MKKVYAVEKGVKVDEDHVDIETRVALIQALIPLGLEAVMEVLQDQVRELAGSRYGRKDAEQSVRRWGSRRGGCIWRTRSCLLKCLECET